MRALLRLFKACIFPSSIDMPESTTDGDLNSHTLADYDCLIKFLALGKINHFCWGLELSFEVGVLVNAVWGLWCGAFI